MRPQNPFEALINQFLSIPQTISQGIIRRDEQVREDRLIGEERARADAIREEQRQQQLTDRANQIRLQNRTALQENLGFINPDEQPELFQNTMGAITQLGEPTALRGQEALDAAMDGIVHFPRTAEELAEQGVPLPVPEPVNVNNLLGELSRARTEAEQEDSAANILFQTIGPIVSDPARDPEWRENYVNNVVLASPTLNPAQKDALLVMAGLEDPEARARALTEQQLLEGELVRQEIETANARTTGARQLLALKQEQRLVDIEYDTAVEQLGSLRDQRRTNDANTFMQFGLIPPSEERAAALAEQLGVTPEELEEQGRARYERIQTMETVELELQQAALQLRNIDIDMGELQKQIADYNLNQLLTFGRIETVSQLATQAFAAAANGDLATVQAMHALAEADPALQAALNLDWNFLSDKAKQAVGDGEAAREFEREQRQALLDQYERAGVIDTANFVGAVGSRFMHTPAEELGSEITEFISNLSGKQLEAFGGEAAVREMLEAEVGFQRRELAREQGGLAVEMMSKAVPEEAGEQAEWRGNFIVAGVQAGYSAEVMGSIADGLLAGADMNYWTSRLRAEQLKKQNEQLQRELDKEGEGISRENITELRQIANASRLAHQDMLSSARCSVSSLSGGDATFNSDDPDCVAAWQGLQRVNADLETYQTILESATIPPEIQDLLEQGRIQQRTDALASFEADLTTDLNAATSHEERMALRSLALQASSGDPDYMAIVNRLVPEQAPPPRATAPSVGGTVQAVGDALTGVGDLVGAINPAVELFEEQVGSAFTGNPTAQEQQSVRRAENYQAAINLFRGGRGDSEAASRIIFEIARNTGLAISKVRGTLMMDTSRPAPQFIGPTSGRGEPNRGR